MGRELVMTPIRVLMIEDVEDDALLVVSRLKRSGYEPSFLRVERADELISALQGPSWDVILADYSLPRFDALSALSIIRKSDPDIPVIIVSGAIGEETAVAAMRAGAHDYVMKNNLARLGPAVERELRDAEVRRQRRRVEAALQESAEMFRALAENSRDVIMRFDRDHRHLYVNPVVQQQTGISPQDFIGKTHAELGFPKDLVAAWHAAIDKVFHAGAPHRIEFLLPTGVWIDWLLMPEFDGKGRVHAVMASARDITERKLAEEELNRSKSQLRSLAAHMEDVRERERTQIARDIHDNLAQLLTALKIDLTQLAGRVPGADPRSAESLQGMIRLVDEATDSVHRVSMQLRPVMLDDLGLAAAVEWHVREFEKRTGLAVVLEMDPQEAIQLDRGRSTALYRILQEALTNVIRHAGASSVAIRLEQRPEEVVLRIADDGRGITKEQLAGNRAFGLIGMRERVYAFNGSIEIAPRQTAGTAITVRLPVERRESSMDTNREEPGRP